MANKPRIRFKGFTEDWEQRKLGAMCSLFTDGDWIESKDQSNEGIRLIQTGNIGVGKFIDKPENKKWISHSTFNNLRCKELLNGDILISRLPQPAGRACIVNTNNEKWITAVDCTIVRLLDQYSNKFILQSLCTYNYFHIIDSFLAGGTRQRVSRSNLSDINIMSPGKIEQNKIGLFFECVDNLITLHQCKLEKLKLTKKVLLQKLFPKNGKHIPEIRFKDFTDAWEQRKLEDLVDVLDGDRGKNYPKEFDFDVQGHTLFLNAANVTNEGFSFKNNQYITEEKSNSMGNGRLVEDDVIITSRGSLGHIAWYNQVIQCVMPHVRINSGMLILRKRVDISMSYLQQFLRSYKGQSQISFISFGSAQPQLTKKDVQKINIIYPANLKEQIKIETYFSTLDNLITLHQRKLERLQEVKKGLLQKMFV